MTALTIVPVTFAEAVDFIGEWHRHHPKATGHKFSIGIAAEGLVVGVASVALSRDGMTTG